MIWVLFCFSVTTSNALCPSKGCPAKERLRKTWIALNGFKWCRTVVDVWYFMKLGLSFTLEKSAFCSHFSTNWSFLMSPNLQARFSQNTIFKLLTKINEDSKKIEWWNFVHLLSFSCTMFWTKAFWAFLRTKVDGGHA